MCPLCGDGEVDDFRLLTIDELLTSLRDELPLWKPNSALVAIDFAMRHGFIGTDEPGYIEAVGGRIYELGAASLAAAPPASAAPPADAAAAASPLSAAAASPVAVALGVLLAGAAGFGAGMTTAFGLAEEVFAAWE